MKKNVMVLTLAVSAFLLTGCGTGSNTEHEHSYSANWSYSRSEHFHKCTVKGCTSKKDAAEHSYGEWEVTTPVTATEEGVKVRKCTVCDYEDEETISIEEFHQHSFSNKYGYDATNHWKVCSVEGCSEKDETTKAAHQFGSSFGGWGGFGGGSSNNDGWTTSVPATGTSEGEEKRTCNVCGYEETRVLPMIHEHTFDTTRWEKNASGHWNPATCEHTTQKGNESGHVYGDYTVTKEATQTEAGSKTATCTVCGYVDTVVIPATGVISDSFTFNSDITTAQKIHTTDQANFLNYSGDYYNITSSQLNSYNAKGDSEKSFPNQVKLTWNYTAPAGKTVKNFSVITGQDANLDDGYTINGTTATNISFYNPFIGTNYFKVVANFTDNTNEVSPIKTFLVEDVAPRNVKIGSMSNCRDMGGRTTVAGGRIKQGLIYRTSDPSGNVNDEVKETLLNRFKVKTEIYVKDGGGNSSPLGSSVKYFNCSMDYGSTPYSNMSRNAERLRNVFAVLGNKANYPTFYHCRIGTDRTGIVGITLNGLLGVSFNETIQDYSFSNFGKIDGQRYTNKSPDPNGDDPAKYIDEILALPGKDFQEKTANALLTIGIPAQTLQNVIDIMTEGNKVTLPTNTTVVNGNALTSNGATKKTSTDYKNPDTYYEISGSSKSVSTTYNVAEAGKVTVVAYLGCTNSSDSTKLASGIDLKIDGASKTICDKTYFKAGFGTTGQGRRTGYMFSILGEYDLTAGDHTFAIAGKNSDTFNVGSIVLIGKGSGAGGNTSTGGNTSGGTTGGNTSTGGTTTGGNTGSGTTTGGTTEHTHTFVNDACTCGATRVAIGALSGTITGSNKSGTPEGCLKLGANGNHADYTFTAPKAGKAKLSVDACMDSWSGNKSQSMFSNNNNANIKFTINGNEVDISSYKGKNYGSMFPDTDPVASNYSGLANIYLGEIDVVSGSNAFVIERLASYNIIIKTIYVVFEK